jgi:hypothetical protein
LSPYLWQLCGSDTGYTARESLIAEERLFKVGLETSTIGIGTLSMCQAHRDLDSVAICVESEMKA